jgi:hypothetical protein
VAAEIALEVEDDLVGLQQNVFRVLGITDRIDDGELALTARERRLREVLVDELLLCLLQRRTVTGGDCQSRGYHSVPQRHDGDGYAQVVLDGHAGQLILCLRRFYRVSLRVVDHTSPVKICNTRLVHYYGHENLLHPYELSFFNSSDGAVRGIGTDLRALQL